MGRRVILSRLGQLVLAPRPVATDRELLRQFAAGDQSAFAALVRRHAGMVVGVCRRTLPTTQDAEDACQATFLLLARKVADGWQESVTNWLFATARRVARDARRAAQRRERRERRAAVPEAVPPLDQLSARELLAALDEELDRLPPHYREPLVLYYLEAVSRGEIATRLGVPIGTVKTRLERGRKRLADALTKRGVAPGAGLLALAVTSPAGACPPRLLESILATASGPVPTAVATLVKGVAVNGTLNKALLALAAVAVALGVGLGALATAGIGSSPDPRNEEGGRPAPLEGAKAAPPDGPRLPAQVEVTIKGSYTGQGGRSEPGASVAVWGSGKKLGESKTTKENVFRVTVPGPLPKEAKVVATKPGFAPDWADVPADPDKTPVELRAVPDEGALSGRVTDLEGRPVANLPVDVERVGRPKPGRTLDDHVRTNPQIRTSGTTSLSDLDWISAEAAGVPTRVTADKDGRFKIVGVGNDRSVRITTRGETTEHLQVRVVTRELDAKFEQHGSFGLHGSTFTLRVGPSRPIVGTVRDARTGDPVPGMTVAMTVAELYDHIRPATTDKDGRFRLAGVKKDKRYQLVTGSVGEAPYFDAAAEADDTPGLDAIVVEVKVYRGLLASGRVIDDRGKPVSGRIFYDWAFDNPHLKGYPGIGRRSRALSHWGQLDREGRYKLLVIPGTGALAVCATPEEEYPRLDTKKELNARNVRSYPFAAVHAVAGVNIDPKDPTTLTRDFALVAGKSRSLVVRAAGGGLPDKLLAVGQTATPAAKPVDGDTLRLTGLSPTRACAVVLVDEAQTVGAVAAVTGDAETPVTVTLAKLGSVSGRVFDAAGNAAAGAEVRVWLVLDHEKYDNLPEEVSVSGGSLIVAPGAWTGFTGRTTKADKDGRFAIGGLLPGQHYRLVLGFNTEKQGGEILHEQTGLTVKAGEAKALGDLKPKK